MKILYFDCSSGISGNMTLGALLEIIDDKEYLIKEIEKLNISGYKIEISKKTKNGITGTYVDVILEENHHHDHENKETYEHHHEHRNINDVFKIIDDSNIDNESKKLSKKIFMKVAKAESKVHNKPIEEVHFHEVGAIDSIIDIVGTSLLINKIKPDKIISSIVNDGYGFINCAHGLMSVPVPATSEIFSDSNVKFRQIDVDTELVTPTGAAIISELAQEFCTMPAIEVKKIGWGAGFKELKIPNILKVYYGEMQDDKEELVLMETNIDDSNAEILGYTMEKLLENEALDVFYTPIYMKKNRPTYMLSVLCKKQNMEKLQKIIFRETTTIGIRYNVVQRSELERRLEEVDTKYGKMKIKKVINDDEEYIYPEYESIKMLAIKNNIPLKELYKLKPIDKK